MPRPTCKRGTASRAAVVGWLTLALVLSLGGACTGGTDEVVPAVTTGATTTTTESSTSTSTSSTTLPPPDPKVFEIVGSEIYIRWELQQARSFWEFDDTTDPNDPVWRMNNNAAAEGFGLALELWTTGFGPEWTGETGEFALGCGETLSGICLFLDPDGPGDLGDLNATFTATGTIEIDQLDEEGFDFTLTDVRFPTGHHITGPLHITGPEFQNFRSIPEPTTTTTTSSTTDVAQ